MGKLIIFEWKKILKTKHFWMMFAVLVLFVCAFFSYNHIHTIRVDDFVLNNNSMKDSFQNGLDSIQEQLEEGTLSEDSPNVQQDLDFHQNEIDELNRLNEAARNEEWSFLLDDELEVTGWAVNNLPSQAEENVYTWVSHFTNEFLHEKNLWIKEQEIIPIFPIHIWSEVTYYDRAFQNTLDAEYAKDMEKNSSVAVYFLYLLMGIGFGYGGIVYFLFLFGDMWTKEGIRQHGPINFLRTQPLTPWKVLLGKFFSVVSVTFLILISAVLLSLLLGGSFDRLGEWNYPVLIYEPDFQFRLMDMGLFNTLSILLFLMVLCLSYSILFLLSILIKRLLAAVTLTILFIIGAVQLSNSEFLISTNIAPYNPFTYFYVRDVLTMELALSVDNFSIHIWNGVISLMIASLVVLLLSYVVYRKNAT